MLARNPKDITVGEILTALEGKFSIIDDTGNEAEQDKIQKAIYELVWGKINRSINGFLEEVTLADLVERYQSLHSGEELMYYI